MNFSELNKNIKINAALYLLNKAKRLDRHSLFKMLYFAEQKHVVRYGNYITDDNFIAMTYGPVPSALYDFIKGGDKNFKVNGMYITSDVMANDRFLSMSAIECLEESFLENIELDFQQRYDKSHGVAYNSAPLNSKISDVEIAKEGGASDDMLDFIRDNFGVKRQYTE